MNLFQSISRSIVMIFDTTTQGLIALNHLARGAAERAVVVEEKSIAAAAISKLRNNHDVARNLQDLYKHNADITPEILAEGKAFLEAYRQERKNADTPEPVLNFIKQFKEQKSSDQPTAPHIPGV